MPTITHTYDLKELPSDNIYTACLEVFKEVGAVNITQHNTPEEQSIESVIPSTWGWGGLKLGIKMLNNTDNTTSFELSGFIAQLGTSPLTSKMDEFLNKLSLNLNHKYGTVFQYDKLTKFLPSYKIHFSKVDVIIILLVLAFTAVLTMVHVFGGITEGILTVMVVLLGYSLGKKYLFNTKN